MEYFLSFTYLPVYIILASSIYFKKRIIHLIYVQKNLNEWSKIMNIFR